MAKKIRDIVREAYQTCQMLGTGQQLSGNLTEAGLQLLNESVYSFNLQQFLPWTRRVCDFAPEGRRCVAFQPVADSADYPNVIPATDKVYSIGDPLKVVAPVPIAIESLLYYSGSTWFPVAKTGFADLQKYSINTTGSVPGIYSYERGFSQVTGDYPSASKPYGIIYFDRGTWRNVRAVYNELLEEYTINDQLDAPFEYEQLFKYDTAMRIAEQNMLNDEVVAKIRRPLDSITNAIKSLNAESHVITYEDEGMSDYKNIQCPWQWDRLK